MKEGDVFNRNIMRRDRQKLLKMGYFSTVSIPQIKRDSNTGGIDMTLAFLERKVNVLDVGLESDDERLVGFFKTNLNHILAHSDFVSLKAQLGLEGRELSLHSYSVRYAQPWMFNRIPISMAVDAWNEFNRELFTNTEFRDNTRQGMSIILGYPIQDRFTISSKLKREIVSPRTAGDFSSYSIHSLGVVLSRFTVTDWFNPKKGSYTNFSFEKNINFGFKTDPNILDFNRYSVNTAVFFPLSPRSVMGLHGFFGVYQSSSSVATFETEGFEVGGSNSLRGYKETFPLVGSRKILVNLEYRYDFSDTFQGVLFADIGDAFDGKVGTALNTLKLGSGFGFRFFTAVGPIRTDFAWGEDFIVHINLGQVF